MTINYAALHTELNTDPLSLGYAAKLAVGDQSGVASLLNAIGVGANFTVFRNDIRPIEVVNAIAAADFSAATALQIAKIQLLFTGGTVDANNANVRANFAGIFSGASAATNTAITSLATRQGNRAEVLFGVGTSVSAADIAKALQS